MSSFLVDPSSALQQEGLSERVVDNGAYIHWLKEKGRDYARSQVFGINGDSSDNNMSSAASVALHWTIVDDREASKKRSGAADANADADANAPGDEEKHLRGYIRLAVAAEASGWLGFGISEVGGMPGSDMFLFQPFLSANNDKVDNDKHNDGRLLDAYAVAFERPIIDDQQDWKLIDSVVEDGIMIVEVVRKLHTGDAMDWPFQNDANPLVIATKIIAAWGDTTSVQYHKPDQRLIKQVRFFASDAVSDKTRFEQEMAKEAEGSVLLKMNEFHLPRAKKSLYQHRCFTASQLAKEQNIPMDKPLHLIGFEWLLDPGDHIHHLNLFQSTSDTISGCNFKDGPTDYVRTLSKGATRYVLLPPDVGMVFIDGSSSNGDDDAAGESLSPKSFRLEFHYEKSAKTQDRPLDSSGVRLYYTSKLRNQIGAMFGIGDPYLALAQKRVGAGIQSHTFQCSGGCTTTYFPPGGVTAISEYFHTHRHTLSAKVVHHRNGELIRSATVQYIDTDQGSNFVQEEPFQILPGDSFRVTCNYDSDKDLRFGLSLLEEMCIIQMFYYPAKRPIHCGLTNHKAKLPMLKNCEGVHTSIQLPDKDHLNRTFGIKKKATNQTQTTTKKQSSEKLLSNWVGAVSNERDHDNMSYSGTRSQMRGEHDNYNISFTSKQQTQTTMFTFILLMGIGLFLVVFCIRQKWRAMSQKHRYALAKTDDDRVSPGESGQSNTADVLESTGYCTDVVTSFQERAVRRRGVGQHHVQGGGQ